MGFPNKLRRLPYKTSCKTWSVIIRESSGDFLTTGHLEFPFISQSVPGESRSHETHPQATKLKRPVNMSASYEFISMRHADEPRPRLSLGERHSADPHLLEVDKTAGGLERAGRTGPARRCRHSVHAVPGLGQ